MPRRTSLFLGIALMTIFVFNHQSAAQVCPAGSQAVPVAGKIFNNVTSTGDTLGLLHLTLGPYKNKCGIMGNALAPDPGFQVQFEHTVVCEDHSQLSLFTQGNIAILEVCPNGGSFAFSFQEVSTPIVGDPTKPSRGLFSGITDGEIIIIGTVNCQLEVDMKFKGYACLP